MTRADADRAGEPATSDARAANLVEAARVIVRETGNFDLPMRKLAARAQVSMRTPYAMFGSKVGIIRALLKSEQREFRDVMRSTRSEDILEQIFDRIQVSMDFYAREQSFYRALFRATQAYSGGDETEPAREMLPLFVNMCRKASEAGHLRDDIDPIHLGEIMTDIFAANLRNWASADFDIQLAGQRIALAFALVLAGAGAPASIGRLHGMVQGRQQSLHRLSELAEAD